MPDQVSVLFRTQERELGRRKTCHNLKHHASFPWRIQKPLWWFTELLSTVRNSVCYHLLHARNRNSLVLTGPHVKCKPFEHCYCYERIIVPYDSSTPCWKHNMEDLVLSFIMTAQCFLFQRHLLAVATLSAEGRQWNEKQAGGISKHPTSLRARETSQR